MDIKAINQVKLAETSEPILNILANRWSPRGFLTNQVIPEKDITTMLEAARWSPSAGNSQPWRVIVANQFTNPEAWQKVLDSLEIGNLIWCKHISLFFVMCARTINDKGNPISYHAYDTGQAATHLSIQAEGMGYKVHQMAGFFPEKITEKFGLANDIKPLTIISVGVLGTLENLNDDLKNREQVKRTRLALEDIILER